MKFSLKTLAVALALAASAGANAAPIDSGAGGNGGLFFNVWDGASSYTLNLGYSINSFETLLAAPGKIDLSFAADSLLTSYLSSANSAKLSWNVLAVDTQGARRIIETASSIPATGVTIDKVRTVANTIQTALITGTTAINTKLATANSATFASTEVGYVGKSAMGNNFGGVLQNFGSAGTLANDSFASGLSLLRVDAAATGTTAKSTYTKYADDANVSVWFDKSNTLHISSVSAVPEPESYAMLLAGLGLLGFAARRNKKA